MQKWIDSKEGLMALLKHNKDVCNEYQEYLDMQIEICEDDGEEFDVNNVDTFEEFLILCQEDDEFFESEEYALYMEIAMESK